MRQYGNKYLAKKETYTLHLQIWETLFSEFLEIYVRVCGGEGTL